jgi:hypothetical protein
MYKRCLVSVTVFRPTVDLHLRDDVLRSLTVKLTLASLFSSLLSVVLVGLFARYQTGIAFDRFVQDRRTGAIVQAATSYYAQYRSWDGLDSALRRSSRFSARQPATRSAIAWRTARSYAV